MVTHLRPRSLFLGEADQLRSHQLSKLAITHLEATEEGSRGSMSYLALSLTSEAYRCLVPGESNGLTAQIVDQQVAAFGGEESLACQHNYLVKN